MQAVFAKDVPYLKRAAIGFVVLLATILRCYHLTDIPLTNDELSALQRLQFSSFAEVIKYGVMPDGHPALVQVFLFYYTKLAGLSVVALKLPFIACGITSVYLAYRVFGRLLNEKTGLLVAAFMASSQFFIMHSQTARPYAPGLLLMLLLTLQLTVIRAGQGTRKHYVFTVVLLNLLGATHYLALLTGVVAAMCFLWHAGRSRRRLLQAYAVAAILYIPQLPIFLCHFKVAGVGTWLGKPEAGFIIDFLFYLAQFDPVVLILLLAGPAVSLFMILFRKVSLDSRKMVWASLGIFAITYGILFLYSIMRNPVLQYPALLFAAPFLLAFAFYPAAFLPRHFYGVLLAGLLVLQCYSLVKSRRHYEVFYNQSYKAAVKTIVAHANPRTPLFLNGNQPFYFDYYFERSGFAPNMITARIDTLTYQEFDSLLRSVKQDTVAIAHGFNLPGEYVSIAREVFSDNVLFEEHAFNETYILARSGNTTHPANPFTIPFGSSKEYGPVQKANAAPGPVNIEASCFVGAADSLTNPELVLLIKDGDGKQVYWASQPFRSFIRSGHKEATIFTCATLNLAHKDDYTIEAFLWNVKKQTFRAAAPRVNVRKGNRLLMGVIRPVE